MTQRTRFLPALVLAAALAFAACGDDDTSDVVSEGELPAADDPAADDPVSPAAGACLEGTEDCVDTVEQGADPGELPPPDDEPTTVEDGDRLRLEAVLGTPENELGPDVRIARRGDETFALTEDYVIGRITVELDEVDGTFVVTSATLEAEDGPVTISE